MPTATNLRLVRSFNRSDYRKKPFLALFSKYSAGTNRIATEWLRNNEKFRKLLFIKKCSLKNFFIQVGSGTDPLSHWGTGHGHSPNRTRSANITGRWGGEGVCGRNRKPCWESGSGIRCLFDPRIQNPGWVKNQDPDQGYGSGILFPRA